MAMASPYDVDPGNLQTIPSKINDGKSGIQHEYNKMEDIPWYEGLMVNLMVDNLIYNNN